MAGGDLDQRVDVWASDEIGQLTAAFNTMTAELAGSRQALVRQNRELRALNAVNSSVGSATNLEQTIEAGLESVREALGADAVWAFLVNDDGELYLARHAGLEPRLEAAEAVAPFDGCVCLDVLETGSPVVLRDLPASCRRVGERCLEGSGFRCHASVPIRSRGETLGVLNVASGDESRFDPEEMETLEALGSALGVAVDNAELWEEVCRRDELRGRLIDRIFEAQEEERRRIAREIHDHTNQVLSSLIVSVDVALAALIGHDDRVAKVLVQTRAECEHILGRLDELVFELRPKLLDDLGLAAALEWLVQGVQSRAAVHASLEVAGLQRRLAPDVETAAFRIAQEALVNVTKHSGAHKVVVDAHATDRTLVLSVTDDGRGFDPERVDGVGTNHFGLLGMRERAVVAGGSLRVFSAVGGGTTVHLRLPLSEGVA